jgi:hypothetical protein
MMVKVSGCLTAACLGVAIWVMLITSSVQAEISTPHGLTQATSSLGHQGTQGKDGVKRSHVTRRLQTEPSHDDWIECGPVWLHADCLDFRGSAY